MTSSLPRRVGWRLAIVTWLAIVGTFIVNTLSNFFPPGGLNVGEVSKTVLGGVLITPASYAFAIWGVIYLALISYSVYQTKPAQRRSPTIRQANRWLIVACLVQMVWIFLFTLQLFWLSVIAMLGILIPLMLAYEEVWQRPKADRSYRRYARTPLSLYLAWISVATVINVASALYASGWGGWGLGDMGWTVIMVLVSAAIGGAVVWTHRDWTFLGVFLWAYGAIAARHAETPTLWVTALIASLGLIGLLITRYRLKG
ncbi:MAG: tryptophan-rich sensory protein, partial [Cyanobacteria bacterium P01_A01_bin.105]